MPERHDGRPRRRDPRELPETPIVAYSAKYASAFYGPFREAAESTPAFGDRRGYQMDPGNVREALRECELDLAEGADVLMVKPALPCLDVIRAARERFDAPLAAYNVSGEYAMVKDAARAGDLDERAAAVESLIAIKTRRRRPRRLVLDEGARGLAVDPQPSSGGARRSSFPAASTRRCARCARSGSTSRCSCARGGRTWRRPTAGATSTGCMSWGPLLFGHADPETVEAVVAAAREGTSFGAATEREVELAAEIVDAVPSVERVRLVSSGTEASMSAIRLARGFTRRDRVLKFAGCYHGHVDALLAESGSGLATLGIPSSLGVPGGGDGAHDRRARTTTSRQPPPRSREYGEGLACDHRRAGSREHGRRPAGAGLPRGAARALRRVAARCSSSTR